MRSLLDLMAPSQLGRTNLSPDMWYACVAIGPRGIKMSK
jgi:hypothetical protein